MDKSKKKYKRKKKYKGASYWKYSGREMFTKKQWKMLFKYKNKENWNEWDGWTKRMKRTSVKRILQIQKMTMENIKKYRVKNKSVKYHIFSFISIYTFLFLFFFNCDKIY